MVAEALVHDKFTALSLIFLPALIVCYWLVHHYQCVLTHDRSGLQGELFRGDARDDVVAATPEVLGHGSNRGLSARRPLWSRPEIGQYRLRLAETEEDRRKACRLRFEVFNLELGEGLASSFASGLDQDEFDLVCDHLLIEDMRNGEIVGTYRMQSGTVAERCLGYYGAREFDFSPFESIRPMVLELGRASIALEHRSSEVLTLLWRGITQYAQNNGLRYMLGCSSLNTSDPGAGWAIYTQLSSYLAKSEFRTSPTAAFRLPDAIASEPGMTKVPKLLKTYLAVGSRICGAPALDREFGTIDFLTLLDLEEMAPSAKSRFCHTH